MAQKLVLSNLTEFIHLYIIKNLCVPSKWGLSHVVLNIPIYCNALQVGVSLCEENACMRVLFYANI